ncbi:hypothetical protein [Seleniivibrio woodruffii]|uniref:Uncharacterized protein n=1 Tax=Seleniivibrio woodruffii TaxID=1078050 RepID=A0A4R1K576_9BACT|nr:hypothetical protein [Seleniivibrio woodruffii]TCK58179.1 hypothetical protein C8D98_2757 [Seleniivibrio woodruffii]TVZ35695.1 hypothetical protein OF66_1311 [Seleniivibrio woodruffii]
MKKIFMTLAIIFSVSCAFAATMVITLTNGKVITISTDEIESISFNEGYGSVSSVNLTGNYINSGQPAYASQQGSNVVIDYNYAEHGKVIGKVKGKVLQGFWIEDASGVRCSSQKDGRYFWGKIVLEVQSNGDLYGKWGYCEDNVSADITFSRQ